MTRHIGAVYRQPATRGDARFGPTFWRSTPISESRQLELPWPVPVRRSAPPRVLPSRLVVVAAGFGAGALLLGSQLLP